MEIIVLEAEQRNISGTSYQLRKKGIIPAILYGEGIVSLSLGVKKHSFEKLLKTKLGENVVLDLKLKEGSSYTAIIKEVQRDPVNRNPLHIDFYQISLKKKIRVKVPLKTIGDAPGVKNGGILEYITRELEVKCLPTAIPEAIIIDISLLEIGNTLTAGNIVPPEEVEIITPSDTVLVTIVAPKIEEEKPAEVAAGPAEPELIRKEKKEEEGEEGVETDKQVKSETKGEGVSSPSPDKGKK